MSMLVNFEEGPLIESQSLRIFTELVGANGG